MSPARALAALLLTAVTAVVAAPPVASAAGPSLPLDRAGRFIADAQGRVVLMHGTNMVYKRPPYAPDATGFGEDDAKFLADEGFTTVRLGLIYTAVEPQPGVYDDAYIERVARTAEILGRAGIVVLLDFHQDLYNERFQGEGFPDWAVQDDGLPAEPKRGFPANYLVMPALQRAFDHFWANDPGPGGVGLQDRFAAAWAHVAKRFADMPNVLGYDFLNEPWPGATGSSAPTPRAARSRTRDCRRCRSGCSARCAPSTRRRWRSSSPTCCSTSGPTPRWAACPTSTSGSRSTTTA